MPKPSSHRDHLIAYADGSCLSNPGGSGGWGVVFTDGREFSGSHPETTNNRMEITAALEALRQTQTGAAVLIRSDSQYVVHTMSRRFRRRANLDLWAEMDRETAARRVRWEWVRGHAGDVLNERADRLASAAAHKMVAMPLPAPKIVQRASDGTPVASFNALVVAHTGKAICVNLIAETGELAQVKHWVPRKFVLAGSETHREGDCGKLVMMRWAVDYIRLGA